MFESRPGRHVAVYGHGRPTLIFVHGFTCSGTDWRRQITHFAPTNRVVVPDLRGHGRSGPAAPHRISQFVDDTVETVLANATDGPCVVVGHSMGCRMALGVATAIPEHVQGVVFIDGSWVGDGGAEELAHAASTRLARDGYASTLCRSFEQMFLDGADPFLREQVIRRALAMPAEVIAELLPDIFRWDALYLPTTLQELRRPVLALQSTHVDERASRIAVRDDDIPWLHLLRRHVRDVTVQIIPSGHFVMLERADEVNAAIAAFLRDGLAAPAQSAATPSALRATPIIE